jgi:HK97 family phage major capsid protein
MPTYDSQITRSDAAALIPEEVSREILGEIEQASSFMQLARRLPNMSRKQLRMPVLASIPQAYFVNGDTGRKQTTSVSWDNVFVNAEELAVLVPVPNAVADDADYDIWGEVREPIRSAIGKAVDQAVYYGINAPAAWPECITEAADAAGHVLTVGTNGDLYDDILGEGGVLSFVEEDGFMVNGHVAALAMRARMRGLRDQEGQPIFASAKQDTKSTYALDGETLVFPRNGGIDPAQSLLISGDWDQVVYAIRQDLTYDVFNSGVITDDEGAVVFNAMQQDSAIMRVVIRLGWAVPNPVNQINPDADTRYPFAVLEPANAS